MAGLPFQVIVSILSLAVLSDAFRINRGLSRGKRETSQSEPDFNWFIQILDHFDPSEELQWNQRYLISDEYYDHKNTGPVFLEISGEIEMTEMTGAGLNYAKTFGAMCFKLEHRYYGKSRPTLNLSVKNLRYLNSHQALGDIANFIRKMNQIHSFPDSTKWIVFGGSYAGSLAAWSRLKYPHLIHAAVASSPVMEPKVEFTEYFETVETVITEYDNSCAESIHQATEMFEKLMNVAGGADVVSKLFKLCSDLDPKVKKQMSNAANDFSFIFPEIIQSSIMNSTGNIPALDAVCNIMKNEDIGLPIDRYSRVDNLLHSKTHCRNAAYSSMISVQGNEDDFNAQRQWLWQSCTELGMFLTSPGKGSMFGSLIDLQYYLDTCSDALNGIFDKFRLAHSTEINRMEFGGKAFAGTRVAFVTGNLDPWKDGGIVETNDPSIIKINIDGVSHCTDMEQMAEDDPIQLVEARKKIEEVLKDWLLTNK